MANPAKLERNIKILKLRFKDWRKSDEIRKRKDGSPLWGYRQLAKLIWTPSQSAIVRICQKRAIFVNKLKNLL